MDYTNKYFEEADGLKNWIEQNWIRDPRAWIPEADLFRDWQMFCQSARIFVGNQKDLVEKLVREGFQKKRPLLDKPGLFVSPHFSPDGQHLAIANEDEKSGIWTGRRRDFRVQYDAKALPCQAITVSGRTMCKLRRQPGHHRESKTNKRWSERWKRKRGGAFFWKTASW